MIPFAKLQHKKFSLPGKFLTSKIDIKKLGSNILVSFIELLVNLTFNIVAYCFEWAVKIMIFIAELIRHCYYTLHVYPKFDKISKCVALGRGD